MKLIKFIVYFMSQLQKTKKNDQKHWTAISIVENIILPTLIYLETVPHLKNISYNNVL